jgi:hypothetical protein
MSKIRTLAAFAVMTVVFVSVLSMTAEDISAETGTCGDALTWSYDTDTQTLTVSGTGEMWDYTDMDAPWRNLNVLKIIIEDGVTSVGDSAFITNSEITQVSFSNSLLSIGDSAFMGCAIASLALPQNLLTMKEGAFAFIPIGSLTIPASVTEIGPGVFAGCASLSEITVEGTNFISNENVLFSGDAETLLCYPAGLSGPYDVPAGTVRIENNAFYNCTLLTSVTMPEGLREIGDFAFTICYDLESVSLPSTLGTIGDSSFAVTGLTSVAIPSNVASIGEHAFGDCKFLTKIEISANVTNIGDKAFALGSSSSPVVCEVHTTAEGILDDYGNEYTTFEYITENEEGDDDDNEWYLYAIAAAAIFIVIALILLLVRRRE